MLHIFNKEQMNTWIRLNECQHLQNSKFSHLWDFDKVEDDINSFIAFLQRKQWKDCNNSILFSIFKRFLKWSQQMIIIVKTKIVYFRELFSDIFEWWRNFGSILFVLQNPWHFWIYTLKISWLFTFSKSADCLHFQISWLLSFKK